MIFATFLHIFLHIRYNNISWRLNDPLRNLGIATPPTSQDWRLCPFHSSSPISSSLSSGLCPLFPIQLPAAVFDLRSSVFQYSVTVSPPYTLSLSSSFSACLSLYLCLLLTQSHFPSRFTLLLLTHATWNVLFNKMSPFPVGGRRLSVCLSALLYGWMSVWVRALAWPKGLITVGDAQLRFLQPHLNPTPRTYFAHISTHVYWHFFSYSCVYSTSYSLSYHTYSYSYFYLYTYY